MKRDLLSEIDWTGRSVQDCEGDRVGKVAEILPDAETGEPEWLLVDTGLFGGRNSFVPLTGAEFGSDAVTVRFEKEQIRGAPKIATGQALGPEDELMLYEHYGVTPQQTGSGNVVPADERLTGPAVSAGLRQEEESGPSPASVLSMLDADVAEGGVLRPDHLLVSADRAKREELPFADEFRQLAFDVSDDANDDLAAWYATRPLKDHERTPVAVVVAAIDAALGDGDVALVRQTIEEGLVALARWPAYLAALGGRHPELTLSSTASDGKSS